MAYTSAYPIILQKELAMGCPVPKKLITTLTKQFSSHLFAPDSSVKQCSQVCKQKRRGMICPLVEITSFMGATLVEFHQLRSKVLLVYLICWHLYTPLHYKTIFYALYMPSGTIALAHDVNPCFPLQRAILLLLCSVSFPTSLCLLKQTSLSTGIARVYIKHMVWWTIDSHCLPC